MPKRKPYYDQAMIRLNMRIPAPLWQSVKDMAVKLSKQAGRKITASDFTRAAIERTLKEI